MPEITSLYQDIKGSVDQIIAKYKAMLGDTNSLTIQQILSLVGSATATFVHLVEGFLGQPGSVRKQLVLEALGQFYDEVIAPLERTKIPSFLEPVVEKMLRQFLLAIADSYIDTLVDVFNKTGWQKVNVAPALCLPGQPQPMTAAPFEPFFAL